MSFRLLDRCRVCGGGPLKPFLDLGETLQSIESRLGLFPNALTRTLMGLTPPSLGRLQALVLAAVLVVPAASRIVGRAPSWR